MLALCANAARTAHGGPGRAGRRLGSFLSAPDPRPDAAGDVDPQARTTDQRRRCGARFKVSAPLCTRWSRWASRSTLAAPLLSVNPVVGLMEPEPPDDVAPIGPGHPLAGLVHLAEGCDVRPLLRRCAPSRRAAAGNPDVGAAARPGARRAVCADVRGRVGAGDVRGEPHRLGADRAAHRLPARPAGRWLVAGGVHAACRSGRTGSTRTTSWSIARAASWCRPASWRWCRRPRVGLDDPLRPAHPKPAAVCHAVRHGQNRDRRRWQHRRGLAVRACCGRGGRSRTWWWLSGCPTARKYWPRPTRCW